MSAMARFGDRRAGRVGGRWRMVGGAAAILLVVAAACGLSSADTGIPGSVAEDTLLFPGEVIILTREECIERNIHTFDDILRLLPGVSLWREGPPMARSGYSIDGRSHTGVTLLVNGTPIVDPWTMESLTRFIPLSRLVRVELVPGGSPILAGDCSTNGFVNVVIEEGGREAPSTGVDFTYGTSKRRVRRAWFATPRAHVTGAIAYDEYLQDAAEATPAYPRLLFGNGDTRSVLMELVIDAPGEDRALCRVQSYEESFSILESMAPVEDRRWKGLASEIEYRRGGLSGSLRQSVLEYERYDVREDALDPAMNSRSLRGALRWKTLLGPVGVRAFATAERIHFENESDTVRFDPSCHRTEAGLAIGMNASSRLGWRIGFSAGEHSVAGRYSGAESAVHVRWAERFSQTLTLARRIRVPSPRELFQPALGRSYENEEISTAGNRLLEPELANEISLSSVLPHGVSLDLFARRENSRIVLAGADTARSYVSDGSGDVQGARARFAGAAGIAGVECALRIDGELFARRSEETPGVPRYRAAIELSAARVLYGARERIAFRWLSTAVGERSWFGEDLEPYHVHDLAVSVSVMSARVTFEMRNILDAIYETAPGYRMPGQSYVIGISWDLLD